MAQLIDHYKNSSMTKAKGLRGQICKCLSGTLLTHASVTGFLRKAGIDEENMGSGMQLATFLRNARLSAHEIQGIMTSMTWYGIIPGYKSRNTSSVDSSIQGGV